MVACTPTCVVQNTQEALRALQGERHEAAKQVGQAGCKHMTEEAGWETKETGQTRKTGETGDWPDQADQAV